MNKKTVWIIVGIVIVVAVVAIISGKNNISSSNKTFKIGIILPLSGPGAAFGAPSQQSVDLALSHLSPEDRAKVSIVYGDDQLDTKQTSSVAGKLIDVDNVNALIVYSSPSSVVASYVAESKSVPMIGLGNATDINNNKKWVQKLMLNPEPQAEAIVSQLLAGKYKKIAIMWNQSDGPKSVHDALVKILAKDGYNVVADESVTKNETDFKASITKIKAAKPDVVVVYISPQVGVFAKQAQDLHLNLPLVSGPTFEIFNQITAAQGGLNNQLYVGNDNTDFINDFYAKYNTYPTIAGDYLYDAVTRLSQAVSQGNKSNSDIVKFLRNSFSGVAGKYTYNGDGSFDVLQVVKKWDGSKFVVVK